MKRLLLKVREKEGGPPGVLSMDTLGWMYLARRFTWGAAEGKQFIVFSIQHVHVGSTSNLHHIEEMVNLYLEHHASLCKQQFLNGSHYTLSLVQ